MDGTKHAITTQNNLSINKKDSEKNNLYILALFKYGIIKTVLNQ